MHQSNSTDRRSPRNHGAITVGALAYHWRPEAWLSATAAQYALERLWELVAGSLENLGGVRPAIEIPSCTLADVHRLVDLAPGKLRSVRVAEVLPADNDAVGLEAKLPAFVSIGSCNAERPVERGAGDRVRVRQDLVAMTFFMLTRWEEIDSPFVDEHGRFPASASTAQKHGFLDQPVVDQWAFVLRSWVQKLCPAWTPVVRTPRIRLSCDVDHPLKYPNLLAVLRKTCGTLVRTRGSALQTVRTLYDGLRALRDWRQDPNFRTIQWLLDLGDRLGSPVAFYFMAADSGAYDEGYDLAFHPYDQLLGEIVQRNHEVGFHPGYGTHLAPIEFRRQQARLTERCPPNIRGGRQHYLRLTVPDTWHIWADAGMSYDSTLTYAESPGFRCGTCHPYPVFDARWDQRIDLVEIPLIAMDATFASCHGRGLDQMKATLASLSAACRQVEGEFALLIHNDVEPSKRDAISEVVMACQAEMRDGPDGAERRFPADGWESCPEVRTRHVA